MPGHYGGMKKPAAKKKMSAGQRKIAGQAMIILNTLEVLGGSATQKDVVDNLIANGLATVQTPKRIYDFYRKMLVEAEYTKLD